MQAFNIVLLQSDSRTIQSLAGPLSRSFDAVYAVRSVDELRTRILSHGAEVAVVDIEIASLSDVQRLSHDFPAVGIVCTHRLADEEMWTAALTAGANDICPSADTGGILMAALRSAGVAPSVAA